MIRRRLITCTEIFWTVLTGAVGASLVWPASPLIAISLVVCLAVWFWFDPLETRKAITSPVASPDPPRAGAGNPRKSVRKRKPRNALSTGSGFFVDSQGSFITNYHVVSDTEDGASIWIEHGKKQIEAFLEVYDPDLDLALCSSGARKTKAVVLREDGMVRLGERCMAAGFPRQQAFTITDGMVSKLSGEDNAEGVMQMSAPVQPGNSGGPLLDRFGHVIGVVVATLDKLDEFERTRHIAENINFAVRLDALQDFLNQSDAEYLVATGETPLDSEQIAAAATQYTVNITTAS